MTLPWRAHFVYAGDQLHNGPRKSPAWIKVIVAGNTRLIPVNQARAAAANLRSRFGDDTTANADAARAIADELLALADQIESEARAGKTKQNQRASQAQNERTAS